MRTKQVSSFNHLLLLIFIFYSYFQYYYSEGCHEEERRALLQIKVSVNNSGSSKLSTWEGKDSCKWVGIECDNSTSRVDRLDLSWVAQGGNVWFPNATLFASFRDLRSLDLYDNNMGGNGTDLLQVICQFTFLEHLDLSGNSLEGVLSPCLGNLTSLRTVDMSYNRFQGDIPSLLNLNALETLYLNDNRFQGMLTLFGQNHSSVYSSPFKSLTSLDVSSNQLIDDGWDLFQAICQLSSIWDLDLHNNSLVGRIHPCVGSMRSLHRLDLSSNQFEGNLPPSLGNMKFIEILNLPHNRLEGSLPLNLGNMSSIRELDLSFNQFHGNIPPSLFKNWNSIQRFDISNNDFVGGLSFSIFANLTSLDVLNLSSNKELEVETDSPSWVSSFQLSRLNLSNCILNKHSGRKIPMFLSNQSYLINLDLSHSSLTGNIPPWLLQNVGWRLWLHDNVFDSIILRYSQGKLSPDALDISNNQIFGRLPLSSSDLSIHYLNMSSNLLQGSIPSSYNLLNMVDLSNNNLTGEISRGLTAGYSSSLEYLALSYNRLEGDILGRDFNMPRLRYLKLQNNRFTGLMPHILSNSRNLALLDLRHNFLSGDISSSLPALPHLRAFLLGENHFEGKIPKTLCKMKVLQFIDLSVNNFSGEIPSCLNNITFMQNQSLADEFDRMYLQSSFRFGSIRVTADFTTKGITYSYEGAPLTLMSGIDISCNQLIGSIPLEIGNLKDLHALNLSNNHLTGSLPTSFRDMKNLESLDLSHNKLIGTLPVELAQLDSLSTFSVAFNNLSGKIPYDKKFLTFNQSSFVGNNDLCGPPLDRNCSVNTFLPQPNLEEEDEVEALIENPLFFYSWVAISYALGFWVVVALLIFKKNWRHKFFRVVDEWSEMCEEKIWKFMKYFKVCPVVK